MTTLGISPSVPAGSQVLGIKLLDGQHQKLLKLCEMAHEVARGDGEWREGRFREIVRDVSVLSSEHFYAEEEFMKKHRYVGLDSHSAKHAEFEDTLAAFLIGAAGDGADAAAFAAFLRDWFTTHIQEEDQDFKRAALAC